MKHLFWRIYFKKPCFIGFKLHSKALVYLLNFVLLCLSIYIIYRIFI